MIPLQGTRALMYVYNLILFGFLSGSLDESQGLFIYLFIIIVIFFLGTYAGML